MRAFHIVWSRFGRDERGASGIEYALLAAMVAVGIGAVAIGCQQSYNEILTNISNAVTNIQGFG